MQRSSVQIFLQSNFLNYKVLWEYNLNIILSLCILHFNEVSAIVGKHCHGYVLPRENMGCLFCTAQAHNGPFPSSPQSLFQSESKCEVVVMIISSNFSINEN